MSSLSNAINSKLLSPSYDSIRLHQGDSCGSKPFQNHSVVTEQRAAGLKSKSHNGFTAQRDCCELEENRKIQIGDLASIGKHIETRKTKHESKLSDKRMNETVHTEVGKQYGKSTTDLHVDKSRLGTSLGRYWNSEYNCDPINDPKYEKRLFYKAEKSDDLRHTDANFNPLFDGDSTYVKLVEPDIPNSPDIVPQATEEGNIRRKLDIPLKSSWSAESGAYDYSASLISMSKKTWGKNPRHLFNRNEAIQSVFRPRSKSDPPNRKPKGNNSVRIQNMIQEAISAKRTEQSSIEVNSAWSANESFTNVLPVPMKVTSFTAAGHEITQEYIFIDSSQVPRIADNKKFTAGNKTEAIANVDDETQFDSCDAKNNLLQSQTTIGKVSKRSFALVDHLTQSENSREANPLAYDQSVDGDNFSTCKDMKEDLNQVATCFSQTPSSKHRPSLSAPTSPTVVEKLKPKPGKNRKSARSTSAGSSPTNSAGSSPDNVPDVTMTLSEKAAQNEPSNHSEEGSDSLSEPIISFIKPYQKEAPSMRLVPSVTEGVKAVGAMDQEKVCASSKLPNNLHKIPGIDKGKWKGLEDKNRRVSETVVNHYQDKDKFQTEYANESSDKDKLRYQSSMTKEVFSEPQRPSARRAAVVASLPDSDLSVLSDTIANLQRNQPVPSSFKRSKWNFPKLSFMNKDKERSREQKLEEVLETWTSSKADKTLDSILQEFQNCKGDCRVLQRTHSGSRVVEGENGATRESKRHNAVWELFTSERTYLIDHLLVLRQVFMEPLQELQCEGFLLSVDVRCLFGNLEELCKVSMDFCHALLKVVGDKRPSQFGSADAIDTAFDSFGSIMCPPYQRYFSGYNNSLNDRENLKSNEDYLLFIEWCERNPRCQRLQLSDLLVAPMQRLTKFPLLLRNIAKFTDDEKQTESIEGTLLVVEESLKTLEGKVSWLNHFQFLQDLQGSISWPPVYEIDNKTILPESLRHALSVQPCKNLIANPKRRLVLEGALAVVENGKSADIYAFLFDDLLLLTKPKKGKRKSSEIPSGLKQHALLKDGTLLTVYRQPVALDRFMVYDVESDQASSMGLKKAFVLVQENRFQQMCSVVMLQANSESTKRSWLTNLASTAAQWMEKNVYSNQNHSAVEPSLHKSSSSNSIKSHTDQQEQHESPHTLRNPPSLSPPTQESRRSQSNGIKSGSGSSSSSLSDSTDEKVAHFYENICKQ